jgi:outer membrane biosynthesis protein TonB
MLVDDTLFDDNNRASPSGQVMVAKVAAINDPVHEHPPKTQELVMKALITAFALLSFVAASTIPYAAQAQAPTHQTMVKKHKKAKKHVKKVSHTKRAAKKHAKKVA